MTDAVRERWHHNNHYHGWLLRHLPEPCERALDVGSGHGFFAARLAERARRVDAVDLDAGVVAEAARLHPAEGLTFTAGDFLALSLPADAYDAVTSIAALHHMPLVPALREMRRVLRPGGRLAVLGLYRMHDPVDYAVACLAVVPNLIRTKLLDPGGDGSIGMIAPAKPPTATLGEIRRAAAAELPGARVHRHVYWRYSLLWEKA
jgi:ubiquinone/menaquinone biosynthesis C-methylase UbiE